MFKYILISAFAGLLFGAIAMAIFAPVDLRFFPEFPVGTVAR